VFGKKAGSVINLYFVLFVILVINRKLGSFQPLQAAKR
jgi:hypothetical protein